MHEAKIWQEVGSCWECLHGVGNGSMPTFCWTILVGQVCTRGVDCMSGFCKQVPDFRIVEEFIPLIQMSALAIASWVTLGEEMQEPLRGRTFGDVSVTMFHPSGVVSDKRPTCSAIDSRMVFLPGQAVG